MDKDLVAILAPSLFALSTTLHAEMLWPARLDDVQDVTTARQYYSVSPSLWEAFKQSIGDVGEDLRLLAAIPKSTIAVGIMQTRQTDGTPPSAVQATQLGLVYRLASRKMHAESNLDLAGWKDPDPWADGNDAGAESTHEKEKATATPGPERKMKFVHVLDQADESEFPIASELQKQAWLEVYVKKTGGLPLETEEPSTEQLSALQRRVSMGGIPYADFSVWLPYGKKALRASKYRAYIPTSEGYITKEIPGPSHYGQWQASWRVYRCALIMLNYAHMSTLVAYEAMVERLDRLYQGCWHLIVQAEDLARGEHLGRLRVKYTLNAAKGAPLPAGWSEANPWDALLRAVIEDQSFWQEQVHVPANAWLAHGSRGRPLTPAEAHASAAVAGGTAAIQPETETKAAPSTSASALARRQSNRDRKDARKRKWEKDREELKAFRAGNPKSEAKGGSKGKAKSSEEQVCYAWNNGNGACANLPPGAECAGKVKRAHRCSKCNSPGHPSK